MWVSWRNKAVLEPRLSPTREVCNTTVAITVILDSENTRKVRGYTDGHFQKLDPKVIDPYDESYTTCTVEGTCMTLPKNHYVQVPWQYINVCGYSDQFCKIPHAYYIHFTYILRTEWVITYSHTELSSDKTKMLNQTTKYMNQCFYIHWFCEKTKGSFPIWKILRVFITCMKKSHSV